MKKFRKSLKYIIIGIVVVGIAASVAYSMFAPLSVPLTLLSPGPAQVYFMEEGAYESVHDVAIFPVIGGKIKSVAVKVGDEVVAGQTIATIDAADLTAQMRELQATAAAYNAQKTTALQQEENRREDLANNRYVLNDQFRAVSAQQRANDATADAQSYQEDLLDEAIKNYKSELKQLDTELQALYAAGKTDVDPDVVAKLAEIARVEKLLGQAESQLIALMEAGSVTPASYYSAQKDSIAKQIEHINDSLEQDNATAMANYYNAMMAAVNANIDRLKYNQSDAVITALYDGRITDLPITESNIASMSAPAAIISTGFALQSYISPKDVTGLHIGDTVEITIPGRTGDTVTNGQITAIDTQAVMRTSALGTQEPKIKVTMDVDNTALLAPNYTVDVKFVVYEAENVLVVPKTALFTQDGQDMVWAVLQDGKLVKAPVTKGVETRTGFVISGLSDGFYVVNDANNKNLVEGKTVALPKA